MCRGVTDGKIDDETDARTDEEEFADMERETAGMNGETAGMNEETAGMNALFVLLIMTYFKWTFPARSHRKHTALVTDTQDGWDELDGDDDDNDDD
jgi:hypothetical protein